MAKKKLSKKITVQVQRYIAILKKDKLPIQKILVYGSYAKGTPHKWSDIDIGIISPNFSDDRFEERIKLMRIGDEIDTAIEPHPFTPEDFEDKYYSLAQEVKKTGIKI